MVTMDKMCLRQIIFTNPMKENTKTLKFEDLRFSFMASFFPPCWPMVFVASIAYYVWFLFMELEKTWRDDHNGIFLYFTFHSQVGCYNT